MKPPVADLTNTFEFRDVARAQLPPDVYDTIAGGERGALERITFRPRLMVNVSRLDLSFELLGQKLFAPILAGPVSRLQTYHAEEAELAVAKGAAAAKSLMIVSSRSSRKLTEIVAAADTPLWFQVYADPDIDVTIAAARRALEAGCKAVCITVAADTPRLDWPAIDRVRRSVRAPLLLKGIMNIEEARNAASHGIDALVVSSHGSKELAEPVAVLPPIVDAVKIPVLVDGGFRRGTDVLKALALGAKAVLVARPVVWGLAAYGAEGVQAVLEMLQTELARNMALCGKPDLRSIDRSLIRIHRR